MTSFAAPAIFDAAFSRFGINVSDLAATFAIIRRALKPKAAFRGRHRSLCRHPCCRTSERLAFGHFGDCAARAFRRAHDGKPRHSLGQHFGDYRVAISIFGTATILASCLGRRDPLRLTATTVGVVLAGIAASISSIMPLTASSHTVGELVAITNQLPGRRQVERHHADVLGFSSARSLSQSAAIEAGQAIDLLDQEDITWLGIGEQAGELRPAERGAALILLIEGRDASAPCLGEIDKVGFCAAGVLVPGRCAEIAPYRHG